MQIFLSVKFDTSVLPLLAGGKGKNNQMHFWWVGGRNQILVKALLGAVQKLQEKLNENIIFRKLKEVGGWRDGRTDMDYFSLKVTTKFLLSP